jgi:alpha-glucosidase
MQSVRGAALEQVHERGFSLRCQGVTCAVSAVDTHVTRVLLTRHPDESCDPTWAVLPGPGAADVPPGGRRRSDLSGWPAPPALRVDASPASVVLNTGAVTVTAALGPSLSLSWADTATGRLFCQDRASRAYALATAPWGALAHAQRRAAGEQYYGLGDKTGPLNLAGRRLRADSADALGADAERGDPLYKAWPLLIVRCSQHATFAGVSPTVDDGSAGSCDPPPVYGVFYDTQCASTFDLGAENSNYHGPYRSFEGGGGALDFYLIYGPTLADVTRRFLALTGRPPLPPRWALGYGLTAMPLADAPDAPQRIASFVAVAREEGIPISSWHFGSGYTLHDGQRMTFEWNKQKFPHPEALTDQLRTQYHLAVVANAKPCLLAAHARFDEAAAAGALVMERESAHAREEPAMALFWDGDGAHIDFAKRAGQAWWAQRATQSLLSRGIDVIWNDNNEYELHEPNVHAGDAGVPLACVRCGMPLLMARTSLEATQAACPQRRAYTITRAGCPGVQRYASTWGGDNASTWESLRWGVRTALQLSISGFGFTGFDIGGFSGPPPEPELLVRAFQAALPWHRYVTNSWKACGSVNSPWLYPHMLPACRSAVVLRYRLMPYLYTLAHVACAQGDPPCTPTFYHWGTDPNTWLPNDDLMLGPCLLCAPVVVPGARQREVYLPSGPPCWFDFSTEQALPAGATATVAAPLEQMPMFCPAGAMLPLTQPQTSPTTQHLPTPKTGSVECLPHEEPSRVVRVFPFPASGTSTFTLVEDDGISPAGASGRVDVHFALTCTAESIDLAVSAAAEGSFTLPYTSIAVALPCAERRKVTLRVLDSDLQLTRTVMQA